MSVRAYLILLINISVKYTMCLFMFEYLFEILACNALLQMHQYLSTNT